MYLTRVELENYGPLTSLDLAFPFHASGNPKPVVFVGQNGAGKSVVLSHIVNAMLSAKSHAYAGDNEVEQGKVYKFRSPEYIKKGSQFYRSYVHFETGIFQAEIQASRARLDFESEFGYTPIDSNWNRIPPTERSTIFGDTLERAAELRNSISKSSLLYFPANRFEEPAWLNIENLRNVATYSNPSRTQNVSNRQVINYAPLRLNQSWLLDVIYDSFAIERQMTLVPVGNGPSGTVTFPILQQTNGPATKLRTAIERFVQTLLRIEDPIIWNVGSRGARQISIGANSNIVVGNLFGLSTGQTALLNIFLTLIRDFDTSEAVFSSLEEVSGLVVIDEIDLHLHAELQHSILPELISLFPKVQFVLTSHSPLFVLGLQKRLGAEGFSLIDLPSGQAIGAERFSEFDAAYRHIRDSARYEDDIRTAVGESQSPILFAEGSIDVDYLNKAAELLGRQASLQGLKLLDANGYGGLDKIWKHFDTNIAQLTNRRVTLLYDCDVQKSNQAKPGVRRIVAPLQGNRISKGIENLFPDELMVRAKNYNSAFIDVTPAFERTVRGVKTTEPETWQVNADEKRNLANWIIENGTPAEFANFEHVFDFLDSAEPTSS
ncbi:MAG TPA: AAA family ATPase [Ensifer sp.]|jgi:hypothetical protein|uniref:AAA family ATPase n=1 Tax=Ensifer sp. TaxID=1872086 RepID=UPI002E118E79|nr:AAA family ATPase [Ensifer sp.]